MATVDVDDSCQLSADSAQVDWLGLGGGLAATRRSVYVHQLNRVNSRNDFGHDDSTINIVMAIIIRFCIMPAGLWNLLRAQEASPERSGLCQLTVKASNVYRQVVTVRHH